MTHEELNRQLMGVEGLPKTAAVRFYYGLLKKAQDVDKPDPVADLVRGRMVTDEIVDDPGDQQLRAMGFVVADQQAALQQAQAEANAALLEAQGLKQQAIQAQQQMQQQVQAAAQRAQQAEAGLAQAQQIQAQLGMQVDQLGAQSIQSSQKAIQASMQAQQAMQELSDLQAGMEAWKTQLLQMIHNDPIQQRMRAQAMMEMQAQQQAMQQQMPPDVMQAQQQGVPPEAAQAVQEGAEAQQQKAASRRAIVSLALHKEAEGKKKPRPGTIAGATAGASLAASRVLGNLPKTKKGKAVATVGSAFLGGLVGNRAARAVFGNPEEQMNAEVAHRLKSASDVRPASVEQGKGWGRILGAGAGGTGAFLASKAVKDPLSRFLIVSGGLTAGGVLGQETGRLIGRAISRRRQRAAARAKRLAPQNRSKSAALISGKTQHLKTASVVKVALRPRSQEDEPKGPKSPKRTMSSPFGSLSMRFTPFQKKAGLGGRIIGRAARSRGLVKGLGRGFMDLVRRHPTAAALTGLGIATLGGGIAYHVYKRKKEEELASATPQRALLQEPGRRLAPITTL